MQDGIGKLRARLVNWGIWCLWEADIAPAGARCISLESRHVPEAGDVWEQDEPRPPAPNVPDAEAMQAVIRHLDCNIQYALAITYAGAPAVMRWRRMGEHNIEHSLKMAEVLIYDALKKSA